MIYNEKKVETLRQRYPEGTRICLVVLSISLDTFYSNKNYAARKI